MRHANFYDGAVVMLFCVYAASNSRAIGIRAPSGKLRKLIQPERENRRGTRVAEVPAIIGVVGGLIGILGGGAAFYDRFYKGRPIASLTTRSLSVGRTELCVRVKNTTSYDVVITGSTEKRGVYFLSEDSSTANIIRGQRGTTKQFILKPDEEKELVIMSIFKDNIPIDVLKPGYIAFWIHWRRGNSTWLPQIPVPVCTTTQTIRQLGGVE